MKKQKNKKLIKQEIKSEKKSGLTFNLVQTEIDQLLDKYSNKETEIKLEKTITEKLAELLPDNETISKNHHQITIKNTEKKTLPIRFRPTIINRKTKK